METGVVSELGQAERLRNAVIGVFLDSEGEGLSLARVREDLPAGGFDLLSGEGAPDWEATLSGVLASLVREGIVDTMRCAGERVWFWVPPLVRHQQWKRRRWMRRAAVVALVVAAVVAAVVWLRAEGARGVGVAPQVGSAVGVGRVVKPCQEDEPCWNSCTMGNRVPCDLSAVLPDGRWFELNMGPSRELSRDKCDGGTATWRPVRVEVSVHGAGGAVEATVAQDWCVPVDDPLNPRNNLPWEELFREAARRV